jgi:hypothetical protein
MSGVVSRLEGGVEGALYPKMNLPMQLFDAPAAGGGEGAHRTAACCLTMQSLLRSRNYGK